MGSVTGADVREALEAAQVPPRRMKAVLRAIEEHGITVSIDAPTRAVAATAKRTVSTVSTHSEASAASSAVGVGGRIVVCGVVAGAVFGVGGG